MLNIHKLPSLMFLLYELKTWCNSSQKQVMARKVSENKKISKEYLYFWLIAINHLETHL